jgi:hypothetical protein
MVATANVNNNIAGSVKIYNALSTVGHPTKTTQSTALIDTACTHHIATEDFHVIDKVITNNPIALTIPNGAQIESTHEAHLDIPGLPQAATLTHIVPDIRYSLVSLSQICDHGGTATVTADKINMEYDGKTVMTASRSNDTSLWHLDNYPISDNTQPFPYYANASIGTNTTKVIVAFFHAAMFPRSNVFPGVQHIV